jgi:Xaa-Pro aminopeptidase
MRAAQAAEAAMSAALAYVRMPDPTCEGTREIIEHTLAALGCELPEGVIVAGGTPSAEPHGNGTGALTHGEPVVIDIYPRSKDGYFADITRTVCLGEPPVELARMHKAVADAHAFALTLYKPGMVGGEIHTAVLDFFTNAGFVTHRTGVLQGEGFIHGVGHGVGSAIHEPPRIGEGSADVLQEGDVVTVEPGLYYKHIGGVRIEDMVVITAHGCKPITTLSRELRVQ